MASIKDDKESESKSYSPKDKRSDNVSIIILATIFLCCSAALYYTYKSFPDLDESEKQYLKIPFDLDSAKQLGSVLYRYKDKYYSEVILGIVLVYIFLQTFAIPGSLFLSILSGFLFSFPIALFLVCFCSALGATLCYTLSQLVGRRIVNHFIPERAAKWAQQINKHKDNLFSYMLFLRMTPILPNWFINLVAPVIGVPLYPFAFGTFIGVAPPSVIAIKAGETLHTLTKSSDAFSWQSIAVLAGLSILSLSPVIFKKQLRKKIE